MSEEVDAMLGNRGGQARMFDLLGSSSTCPDGLGQQIYCGAWTSAW
jgi:hypothetical protein